MAQLSLSGITKAYGTSLAVRGVSLEVKSGEFVSFLGPSGSGKTTTLSMVAGFVAPSDGQIMIGGRDITHVPPYKRNIGMVFQDYSLFPHMTVEKNIAFPMQMQGIARDERDRRVGEVMEIVGLDGMGARFPAQLSGGQQQRVAIARAIVYRPQILLMDEPLGALDRMLRERLQLEIKHIQKQLGITTLYVTHDQGEALTMSDRVCVFNNGRIEQVGKPVSLYEQPDTRFIAGFLGESNFLSVTLTGCTAAGSGWDCGVTFSDGQAAGLPSRRRFAPGQPMIASIRPENIRLLGDAEVPLPGTVVMTMRVRDVIYRGENSTLRGHLADGTEISMRVTATDVGGLEGRELRVGWPALKMVLLDT